MVHEPIYEIKRNSGTVVVFFYFDCTWYQYPFPMLELNQIDPTTPFSLPLPMSARDWCPDLTFKNTAPWSFPFPLQITAFYFNSRFPLNFPSPPKRRSRVLADPTFVLVNGLLSELYWESSLIFPQNGRCFGHWKRRGIRSRRWRRW